MLADSSSQIRDVLTTFITTVHGKVISNGVAIYFEDIVLFNQEEADTKLILYLFHGCRKGYKKLTIAGSGTDTVMLLFITFMILIGYCIGQHKRWLPVHEYATCLGEEICGALSFWLCNHRL